MATKFLGTAEKKSIHLFFSWLAERWCFCSVVSRGSYLSIRCASWSSLGVISSCFPATKALTDGPKRSSIAIKESKRSSYALVRGRRPEGCWLLPFSPPAGPAGSGPLSVWMAPASFVAADKAAARTRGFILSIASFLGRPCFHLAQHLRMGLPTCAEEALHGQLCALPLVDRRALPQELDSGVPKSLVRVRGA